MAEGVEPWQLVLIAAHRALALRPDAMRRLGLLHVDLHAPQHRTLDRLPAHTEELGDAANQPVLHHILVDERSQDGIVDVLVSGVPRATALAGQVVRQELDDAADHPLGQLGLVRAKARVRRRVRGRGRGRVRVRVRLRVRVRVRVGVGVRVRLRPS